MCFLRRQSSCRRPPLGGGGEFGIVRYYTRLQGCLALLCRKMNRSQTLLLPCLRMDEASKRVLLRADERTKANATAAMLTNGRSKQVCYSVLTSERSKRYLRTPRATCLGVSGNKYFHSGMVEIKYFRLPPRIPRPMSISNSLLSLELSRPLIKMLPTCPNIDRTRQIGVGLPLS